MTRRHTSGRAVERVTRICAQHLDTRSLRLAVLDDLRDAIGFEAYAWLLTDPVTESVDLRSPTSRGWRSCRARSS